LVLHLKYCRVVAYEAGPEGFFAQGDTGPDEEAVRYANELAEYDHNEKLPFLKQWSQTARRTLNDAQPKQRLSSRKFVSDRPSTRSSNTKKQTEFSFYRSNNKPEYSTRDAIFKVPKLAEPKQFSAWKNDFSFLNDPHTYVSLRQEGPSGYNYNYSY